MKKDYDTLKFVLGFILMFSTGLFFIFSFCFICVISCDKYTYEIDYLMCNSLLNAIIAICSYVAFKKLIKIERIQNNEEKIKN